jgi:hypothetical protein
MTACTPDRNSGVRQSAGCRARPAAVRVIFRSNRKQAARQGADNTLLFLPQTGMKRGTNMAKIVESAVSSMNSFRLGWHDAIARKVGKDLASAADSKAYMRGVERAARFRKLISASAPELRAEATGEEGRDRPHRDRRDHRLQRSRGHRTAGHYHGGGHQGPAAAALFILRVLLPEVLPQRFF